MIQRLAKFLLALSCTECSVGSQTLGPWKIGPIINGKSLSPGMPASMTAGSAGGWYFDFPQSPNSVHYVTKTPTEAARSGIRMSFEIVGNVEFKEADCGGVGCVPGPGMVRLYIQRCGDDWRTSGFRFWSPPLQLSGGALHMDYALDPSWIGVYGTDPDGFRAAVSNLCAVGFTFGGRFAGHGVYAIAPARFVLTEFTLY
jgi:hypothetical protein